MQPIARPMKAPLAALVVLTLLTLLTLLGACGRRERGGAPAPPPAAAVPEAAGDQPANAGVADFRGFVATEDLIRQRLTTPDFFLDTYLGETTGDLAVLLGASVGNGQHSSFQNGKANAINLVLWHLALAGVARDLAAACGAPAAAAMPAAKPGLAVAGPALAQVLAPLCAWPAPQARAAGPVEALWRAVVEDDAPPEELAAFTEFALGDDVPAESAQAALTSLLTAMLLNPHFLIRP